MFSLCFRSSLPRSSQGRNACIAYDPATSRWLRLPPIPGSERCSVLTLQLAALAGRLIVSGVVERENALERASSVFAYDPAANQWSRVARMPTGRWFCLCGSVGDRLYMAGGIGTENSVALVETVEAYTVGRDEWEKVRLGGCLGCLRPDGWTAPLSRTTHRRNAGSLLNRLACVQQAPRSVCVQVDTCSRLELMTLPGYQAVLGGRLYAKNIGWGNRLGIVFDPAAGTVAELSPAMVQVGTAGGPVVAGGGAEG